MSTLILLTGLVAVSLGAPLEPHVSVTQDTLGNYNLRYATPDSSANQQGTQDGSVVGSYTFQDPYGQHHSISYTSGASGYVAHGADIPHPVPDTPEVAAARANHLAVVARERSILPPLIEEPTFVPVFVHPAPVFHHQIIDHSAEIAAARAQHFAAHQEVLAQLAAEYAKISH